jgi:predicted hotdog family 3-hydroxylacyl-ACP dehydratase
MPLPINAMELIPHRPPLCLIDKLISYENEAGCVTARIKADHPFIHIDGKLEPTALIEIVAQAYAAIVGYRDLTEGKSVERGFLVGIRKFQIHHPAKVGDQLQIEVATIGKFSGFAVAEGQISCNNRIIANGSIKLWTAEEPTQ